MPETGVVAMLDCAEGKFAGWKRGMPGSRREPFGLLRLDDDCCRVGRRRCWCTAECIAVPLMSMRGEAGCLVGRYDGERPAILRFEGVCEFVEGGRGTNVGPLEGAVVDSMLCPSSELLREI